MSRAERRIELSGHEVELTSEDKVLFPDDGITKGDMLGYYRKVAEVMLPHMRDRPLTLRRYPNGIAENGFYQHDAGDYFPEWLRTVELEKKEGGKIDHILCRDAASLLYLANQGTIAFHGWLSRCDKPDLPDKAVFDLDPPEGDFSHVRDAALALREPIEKMGLTPFVMTTGSKGLHIAIPIRREADFDTVRKRLGGMAKQFAEAAPDLFTTQTGKSKREGKIYLDIQRCAWGQTAVLPYSLRALPGAPVATPVDWEELESLESAQRWTLKNLPKRLAQKDDPWKDFKRHAAKLPMS